MLECVFSSDWHLTDKSNHFSDILQRQIYELDKVYSYCIDNGIRYLFVPGDIGDTDTLPEAVKIALIQLWSKYDGHVETFYIAGNHDFNNIRKTSMDMFNLIQKQGFKTLHIYLKPEREEIEGVRVNFLPYPCVEAPKSKKPSLNVSHVSYNGALGDNGRKLRVSNEFIQNPQDFNVSGHIHMYQYLESKNALYCGSLYQKNFGEPLPKGWVHLKARNSKGVMDVRHRYIENKPSFQFINLRIDSRKDLKKLSDSDSFRYKLWVAPDVILPDDLKLRFPNITGGVFDISSKSKERELVVAQQTARSISVKRRLREFLQKSGYDENFVKIGISDSRKAASSLGINLL